MAKGYVITPTKNAKNFTEDMLDELYDYMGLSMLPINEDTPCPWDADFNIEDGKLVLVGGAGPSGFGYCKVAVPIADAGKMFKFDCYDMSPEMKDKILKCGWAVKEA